MRAVTMTARTKLQFGNRQSLPKGWIKIAGRPRLSCIVRHISADCASLDLQVPAWLPYRFDLIIETDGRELGCEVSHVSNTGIRVILVKSETSQATVAPGLPSPPQIDIVEEWAGGRTTIRAPGRAKR